MSMSMGSFHCSHSTLTPHSLSHSYLLFSLLCANESRLSQLGKTTTIFIIIIIIVIVINVINVIILCIIIIVIIIVVIIIMPC